MLTISLIDEIDDEGNERRVDVARVPFWAGAQVNPNQTAVLFLPMPPPEHVPLREGPAPEEGMPRVSGEPSRRKGSAHMSPAGRGLRAPARGAPPRRARGVLCPGAINLAEIRDLGVH